LSAAGERQGVDKNDNVHIGGSMRLSCRDMARLGQLYLNGGRWNDEQLIDAQYIRDAITPSKLNPSYGYLGGSTTPAASRLHRARCTLPRARADSFALRCRSKTW